MHIHFANYTLDPQAQLLKRDATNLVVPQRVFALIRFLIEHRERAVSKEELVKHIWRRANVSDNQLAHLVNSARKLLGDDGDSQRWIRTIPGFGYHWIGEVEELSAAPVRTTIMPATDVVAPQAARYVAAAADSNANATPMRERFRHRKRAFRVVASLVLAVLVLGYAWTRLSMAPESAQQAKQQRSNSQQPSVLTPSAHANPTPSDPLGDLRKALQRSEFETVRVGLANLPPATAESAAAKALEVELMLLRGRFAEAQSLLRTLNRRAGLSLRERAEQLILDARLAYISNEFGRIDAANEAVLMLDGVSGQEDVLARALSMRGVIDARTQPERALQGYARAKDLFVSAGDTWGVAAVASNVARVKMQQGKLIEALAEIERSASEFAKLGAASAEIYAHFTAARINLALLRRDAALVHSDQALALLQKVGDAERRYRYWQLRAFALAGTGRLREARLALAEVNWLPPDSTPSTIPGWLALADGRFTDVLTMTESIFARTEEDPAGDISYDSKSAALLLWVMAAEAQSRGGTPALLPNGLRETMAKSEWLTARVARGRWQLLTGDTQAGVRTLSAVLAEPKAAERINLQVHACMPLVGARLRQKDLAGAQTLFTECRSRAPDAFDADYELALVAYRLAKARDVGAEDAFQRVRLLAGERDWRAEIGK